MKVIWTGSARQNLDAIWLFVAQDNIDAADALMDTIRRTSTLLELHPRAGRPGKAPGTREFVVSGTPYMLLYRIAESTVQILGVIHGARDWPPKRGRA
jgi:toxin ParE1/3/4